MKRVGKKRHSKIEDTIPPDGIAVIETKCPVCKQEVEMAGDECEESVPYVMDTDSVPWQLYHEVCYRMAHPRQRL
jgi:hypothetical protein